MFIEEERIDLTLASVKSHLLDVEYYNVIFHVKGKNAHGRFFYTRVGEFKPYLEKVPGKRSRFR